MTERLYYTDARLLQFAATVVALDDNNRRVILDRTAFYPTSGGQPFDRGRLGSTDVVDVIDDDAHIVHVCASPLDANVGDVVEGHVESRRRFDHMQQHSGQHLISALLADAYGWPTVSVHFGDVTNTVDVPAASISPELIIEIEERLNRLAAEGHAITVSFEDAASATGLRKPSDRDGLLRIVSIDGLDRSACGGTHVSSTGEIGSILLRRTERTKGNTRIEFVCGLRAVARARADAALLTAAARTFTASPEDVPSLVEAQQTRVADLERERKRLSGDLATYEARALWESHAPGSDTLRRLRLAPIAGPVREAESLVQALITLGPCVVVAHSPSTQSVMLGAGDGSGIDAGKTLRAALQTIGGRGGGSPRLAQGSGGEDMEPVIQLMLNTPFPN